jgi:hypothetical protein
MARKRMSRKWPFLGNKCFKRGCKARIVKRLESGTPAHHGQPKAGQWPHQSGVSMHKRKYLVSHLRLTTLLDYDSATGRFTWKTRRSGQPKPGSKAGTTGDDGYCRIRIDGLVYIASRLAFFYVNKRWPKFEVDHRDLDRSNNALVNLREATHGQNMANVRKRKGQRMKGAYYQPDCARKWYAQISVNRKPTRLGSFHTEDEAHAAYCIAARRVHGEFAREG